MDGWMDGWVDGWMDGSKSRFKDCLQQSKIQFEPIFELPFNYRLIIQLANQLPDHSRTGQV
jgi:hypothetical protein